MSTAGCMRLAPAGIEAARNSEGFTLMDLVAALAIAGLLACLAVPSYRAHLIRAHRAEARSALLALAAAEESFHLECNGYTAVLDESVDTSCSPPSLRFPASAGQGDYALVVTSADATGWAAAATAVIGGQQERDERCRVFRLDSTGGRTASTADGIANDEDCWSR